MTFSLLYLLTIAGLLILSFAILYPDDSADRLPRITRTAAASAAFCGALLVSANFARLFNAEGWAGEPIFGRWTDVIFLFAISLFPFGIAERVARLFRARRRPWWAVAGIAGGLAWAGAFSFVIAPGGAPAMAALDLALYLACPGAAAGLAWFAFLPVSRAEVTGVFD